MWGEICACSNDISRGPKISSHVINGSQLILIHSFILFLKSSYGYCFSTLLLKYLKQTCCIKTKYSFYFWHLDNRERYSMRTPMFSHGHSSKKMKKKKPLEQVHTLHLPTAFITLYSVTVDLFSVCIYLTPTEV